MGIDEVSLQVDLLGKVPQRLPLPSPSPYGWHPEQYHDDGVLRSISHIVGAVEAEGRRFCLLNNGLCEIDAAGKPLRTWGDERQYGHLLVLWVATPADCPIPAVPRALGAVGPRLILTSWNT